MANYATLKAAIQDVIKTNGNNEITGAILQQSLLAMVNSLGAYYQFAGVAIPGTDPGTPDQNVFYIAGPGTYPNFSATVINDGYIGVFRYNGSWTIDTLQVGKNYDADIEELQNDVNKILDALTVDEPVVVPGFNSHSLSNGTSVNNYIMVFKPVLSSNTEISKFKLRVNRASTSLRVKLASVYVNASNQVLARSVSGIITITPDFSTGTIGDVEINLQTPFVVNANERLAIVADSNQWFRKERYDTNGGTYCAVTNFPSGNFDSFTDGSRISSNISYLNFDAQAGQFIPYSGNVLKEIPSVSEMNAAIAVAKASVEAQIEPIQQSVEDVEQQIDELNANLKGSFVVSKYETEKCAHCASIIDGEDGYFYVAYYASDSTVYEGYRNPFVCRLSRVSQYDLNNTTIIDVLKRGDVVGSFTQDTDRSPYDPNLLLVGDDTIRYFMAIAPVGGYCGLGYRDITKSDLSLANSVNYCNIKYTIGGVTYTEQATHENLDTMINRYFGQASGGTIGGYPILTTPFVKVNNVIYGFLAGLGAGSTAENYNFSGAIVKSTDNGITWEIIAWANDLFTARVDYPVWEAGLAILDNKVYVLFKFADTPIAYYDLSTNQWSQLIYLFGYYGQGPTIDNAKPFLYLLNGKLYAMQNVLPRVVTSYGTIFRSRVGCYRLTPVTMAKEAYFELASDSGCQYFSIINQKGRLYFCFTEDKAHKNYQMKGDISIIQVGFLPSPQ